MKNLSVLLLTVIVLSFSAGCSIMDRDLFFRDSGINVVSCPTNVELIVNGQSCVTPCSLSLPNDTANVTVTHYGQSTVVPLKTNTMHSYSLNGTLVVMNPANLGNASDRPDTVYFIRDFKNAADVCGSAAGSRSAWTPLMEDAEVIEEDYSVIIEEEGDEAPDIDPITALPAAPAETANENAPESPVLSEPVQEEAEEAPEEAQGAN